jgi:hypothetical protein
VAALLLAGLLVLFAVSYSGLALWRCRRQQDDVGVADEVDELELKLAERRSQLERRLARRNVEAFGRAALFGGTGCAVWELTGGSAHYLQAGVAFGLGLIGWMGCGELHRRIGALASSAPQTNTTRSGSLAGPKEL